MRAFVIAIGTAFDMSAHRRGAATDQVVDDLAFERRLRVALEIIVEMIAEQAAGREPNEMTDQQIREFIEGIPLLKQTIASIEEEAKRRFESGHPIDGLKAIRGPGRRKWRYEDEEMTKKFKSFQIPKTAMFVTKLISPAQAEKIRWEKRDGTHKTLSKRQLETLHRDYIDMSEGKIQIVPEAHEGKAVNLAIDHGFEAVKETPLAAPAPAPETTELPAWLA